LDGDPQWMQRSRHFSLVKLISNLFFQDFEIDIRNQFLLFGEPHFSWKSRYVRGRSALDWLHEAIFRLFEPENDPRFRHFLGRSRFQVSKAVQMVAQITKLNFCLGPRKTDRSQN